MEPTAQDIYRQKVRSLVRELIDGVRKPESIPTGREFTTVQFVLQKMGRRQLVAEMATIAMTRMLRRGYIQCGPFGWIKKAELPISGIGQKHGYWVVTNQFTYENFTQRSKQPASMTISQGRP